MLVAKLIRMEEEKREAEVERLYGEKGEISFGHQIRSYTLQPYTLVKDLRTGLEVGNADGVLDGNILKFMEAYLRHRKKLGGGAQEQDARKS
jgi:peptide chain release factor 2